MNSIKSIRINEDKDCIEVKLEDNSILEFKVGYSEYEDCVNLSLDLDGIEVAKMNNVIVIYTGN